MKLNTARKILKAMDNIMKRGEHFEWCGLTHISNNAGQNRQTTYRYLEAMVKNGQAFKVESTWRGETCYRYYMTSKGIDLLHSSGEFTSLGSVTK
jgi:predicted transcriptional regulator